MDTSSMPEMTVSGPASGGNRPESLSGGAYPDQEKGKSRKPWWRRLIKVLLIVAVSLAGLFVLLGGVVWLVLTPPRLTPLVNRVATKYLNAEVHFDTVRLSLFENFPHVSLELKNGEVISGVFAGIPDSLRGYVPQRADSLLRFKEFAVTLNLPRLLAAQNRRPPVEAGRSRYLRFCVSGGQCQLEYLYVCRYDRRYDGDRSFYDFRYPGARIAARRRAHTVRKPSRSGGGGARFAAFAATGAPQPTL